MKLTGLTIDVITLFPSMFDGAIRESIVGRAVKSGRVKINIIDLRDYCEGRHRKADDKPYGGGAGMVLMAEPIFKAVRGIKKRRGVKPRVVFLTPQGTPLEQPMVKKLAKTRHIVLICGHYEGVDERVRKSLVTDEISIGDYVLTCGEIPAMVLIDAVTRLLPGVLGDNRSARFDSFEGSLLEHPHYTRPAEYKNMKVPAALLSGDHKRIEAWRRKEALKRTLSRRPDLLEK